MFDFLKTFHSRFFHFDSYSHQVFASNVYTHIIRIKYCSDDLEKVQFGGELSRDTIKISFKNNIWNPDHPRPLPTINRSQSSFVKPISRKNINENNFIEINFNTIFNTKKPVIRYKPPRVYILNATSLVTPHGIESLRCEVFQLRPDIVIITELWLKSTALMERRGLWSVIS